ncbi:hypothetical protein [Virgibacillus siamensis]|uniref:hypothetical protein n=1 Tax=Virgibacillus siamensis TaxID=480071 RepID=UPI0009857522|nr:hypothetical protein [Virgibacillus siamensis]
MDKQEQELEELAKQIKEKPVNLIPHYETFVTFVSVTLAILFIWAETLDRVIFSLLMTQSGWAISFMLVGLTSAFGLLFNINWLRKFGMISNFTIYIVVAIIMHNYIGFNATSIVFGYIAIFCLVGLPYTEYTKISRKGRG